MPAAFLIVLLTLGTGPSGLAVSEQTPHSSKDGENSPVGPVATDTTEFGDEISVERCAAMMGAAEGMRQAMRSMRAKRHGENGDTRGRRGEGMRHHRMQDRGPEERQGPMRERMRQRMGAMEPEDRRNLCQTMRQTMREAMDGEEALPAEEAEAFEEELEALGLSAETREWLSGARGFETIEDRTGEPEVTVTVGAAGGLQYGPTAVRVDPGTTVRWEWTGDGGLHDVAFVNADPKSPLRADGGFTFTHSFDEPGEYLYECTPHAAIGMRGAIIVDAS